MVDLCLRRLRILAGCIYSMFQNMIFGQDCFLNKDYLQRTYGSNSKAKMIVLDIFASERNSVCLLCNWEYRYNCFYTQLTDPLLLLYMYVCEYCMCVAVCMSKWISRYSMMCIHIVTCYVAVKIELIEFLKLKYTLTL